MFRKSLQAVARPSRSYVCLFCFSRTFERSFIASSARREPAADVHPSSDRKDGFILDTAPVSHGATESDKTKSSISRLRRGDKTHTFKPKSGNPTGRSLEEPSHDETSSGVTTALKKRKKRKKVEKSSATYPPVRSVLSGRASRNLTGQEKEEEYRQSKDHERVPADDLLRCHSGILEPSEESIKALNVESTAVPTLAYNLDRVLFNPGVYHLRDPRSRVYNFDPYLSTIMPVSEFDFEALGSYITSSRDVFLREMAQKHGKKYIGSSSSMTGVLSHFHFLLSAWRPLKLDTLSQQFSDTIRSFTRLTRAPAAVFLRYKGDGIYAIDADKEFDSANILMNLGRSMEKLLTMPTDEYERYRRTNGERTPLGEAEPETYHYSTCGDFLMRAQLDAYDPRLPGTGMFDLKTRAVVSIRMDAKNPDKGIGYEIKDRFGDYESFEREYFDMARSAFLKYSLQVRVGRMDGIFVAFHNTQRIFGFQYLALPEMDRALHGQEDVALGDAEFVHSITLWNKVLNAATAQFPEQSLRFHFETRDGVVPFMYIFAEPVTEEEIDEIQTRNQEEIEKIQHKLLYPELYDKSEGASDSVDEEAKPAEEVKEADGSETTSQVSDKPVMGMILRICNNVNGRIVPRPERFVAQHKWTVDYNFDIMSETRGKALLAACKRRREKCLSDAANSQDGGYGHRLWEISSKGRKWRKAQDALDKKHGIVTLND
ncbi:hypothetical protein DIZ76_010098 [Coccidioides immitis]|nr:hypothetical protein DIZ76_010098 [Coccidioides immitis]